MKEELLLKINNAIDRLIDKEEEESYNKLSIIGKILTSTNDRLRSKEVLKEKSKEFILELIDFKEIEYWGEILKKYEPVYLYNTLIKIIDNIKDKKEPKNEWLEKRLNKLPLKEDLKILSKKNMEDLIRYAGLIYSMEETNKRITGYRNKEVRELYPLITNIPCFKNFNELVVGFTSVLKYGVSLEALDKSLLQQKEYRLLSNIKDKYNKFYEENNGNIINGYVKINKYHLHDITQFAIKELIHTDVFNIIKDVQVNINNNVKQTLSTYLKLIYDKDNEVQKIMDYINNDTKNMPDIEVEYMMRNVSNFVKKIYGTLSFDEYEKFFYATPIDDKKESFFLINSVIENNNYQKRLLNKLSNDDLDILSKKSVKNNCFFEREVKELNYLIKDIKDTRVYDKEIEKFKNGEDTLNLQIYDTKLVSVDLEKLSLLLRNKITSEAQVYVSNDDYVLNIQKGKAKLFLIGEYANHLDKEECLEIFMEIIHEHIGNKRDQVEPLIRGKKLKYKLSQEVVEEKNNIVSRRKI